MRGHPLVEVEDLVGLGAAGRPVAREILQATPFALVCCNERVEIHDNTVFATAPGSGRRPDTLPLMKGSTQASDTRTSSR